MQVSIAFSGAAGTGVMTAGNVLGKILSEMWYFVVWDKQYESIIKGGNNLFVLYISDKENYFSKKIDHFFAYDKYALERNEPVYEIADIYEISKTEAKHQNTFSVAAAMKILGLDLSIIEDIFKNKFDGAVLDDNLADLKAGYSFVEKNAFSLKHLWKKKVFITGNQAIADGAVGWCSS